MHLARIIIGVILMVGSIWGSFWLQKEQPRKESFKPQWTYGRLAYLFAIAAMIGSSLVFLPLVWPR